jgi:hypothetical protein
MARPQTENGFVMIALDLFAAIMAADLPNREMIVLAEVLLQSYGPMKRRDVHLDPPTIEHYTGLHRNNVHRAIRGLVEGGILRRNADGSFRFVKDWESWTPGGSSLVERLAGGIKRFAMAALSRFGGPIKPSKKSTIPGDSENGHPAIQLDCPTGVKPNPTGLTSTTVTQSNGIQPPGPPYKEPRAEEELESREREKASSTPTDGDDDEPDDVSLSTNIKGHWPAVAEAKACFGDDFARVVHAKGHDIGRTLGGRFDLFAAAIREAKETPGEIKNLYAWCLRVAGGYGESPPAPKVGKPAKADANGHRGTPEERAREQLKARAERQAARAAGGGS